MPKAVYGELKGLFFSKRGCVLTLRWKGGGHPCGISYPIDEFESPALAFEVEAVNRALGGSQSGSIYQLPSGVYVHRYKNSLQLTQALGGSCILQLCAWVYG